MGTSEVAETCFEGLLKDKLECRQQQHNSPHEQNTPGLQPEAA